MENSGLNEIKNRLAMLPALEQRMKNLRNRIMDAEDEVKSLLHRFESESLDVEHIQKDSLSNTLLKIIGKYEGKVNKETQEMLTAKMAYDKAAERVKELRTEQSELSSRISDLYKDKQTFEDELLKREQRIKNNITDHAYITYTKIQKEQDFLSQQLVENEEALNAGNRAVNTANDALRHLESAENWATYDIWGGGGIISHMAKYEHIDDAERDFNRLNSLVMDFQKELSDVSISYSSGSFGVDSTTRAVDFWFDNIFTDLNVRDKIRNDNEQIRNLCSKINRAINQLENNKKEIIRKLGEAENMKKDLIISSGE